MPTQFSPDSHRHQSPPSLRAELIEVCISLWRKCFDRYRPELHYMRGPGPRWREKYGRA